MEQQGPGGTGARRQKIAEALAALRPTIADMKAMGSTPLHALLEVATSPDAATDQRIMAALIELKAHPQLQQTLALSMWPDEEVERRGFVPKATFVRRLAVGTDAMIAPLVRSDHS
jgi:hypothetical protein